MATSGTIGTTVINTVKMLEKAVRRCGKNPAELTPEDVTTAKESMFMFLLSLSNRGLNLWCVDRQILGLHVGKASYILPIGTQSLLNVLHSTPTPLDGGTETYVGSTFTSIFTLQQTVTRFGVKLDMLPTNGVIFQTSSDDGATWVNAQTFALGQDWEVGTFIWLDLAIAQVASAFRLVTTDGVIAQVILSQSNREIPVAKFNRDDYANQPDKNKQSNVVTNYYFEKLVNPQVTFWPVPNSELAHAVLFRYRQIQDIGALTNELEIPARWYEAICWHLALRLAFELPGVDPKLRQEVREMANSMTLEVEDGETDNAPSYYAPNIGVYTA